MSVLRPKSTLKSGLIAALPATHTSRGPMATTPLSIPFRGLPRPGAGTTVQAEPSQWRTSGTGTKIPSISLKRNPTAHTS
jgi:hypothetical protein